MTLDLPTIPKPVLEWLAPDPPKAVATRAPGPPIDYRGTTNYARTALDAWTNDVASAPEGTRNNTLNNGAVRMGHLIAGNQIDEVTVTADLTDAARSCGLRDAEIAKTIASGLNKGKTEPEYPTEREGAFLDDEPWESFIAGYRSTTPRPKSQKLAPTLPESFWVSRNVFEHIRDAARHFMVSPDAVFYGVVARIAAYTNRYLGLPEMPRYGSLNLFVNLVGPSGVGKGASTDRAKQLVRVPADLAFLELPAGSGEGMTRSYFTKEDVETDGGKPRQEWRQTIQSVLFRVDEGRFLKAMGERSGQTTGDTLLSGFSGEQLGGNYTDPDKRGIIVPAHNYRMVMITGIQPENAQFILDDHISGFPQRQLWSACVDPGAPAVDERPADPGPLSWKPPDYRAAESVLLNNGKTVERRHAVSVAPDVAAEILERRHAITTGAVVPDALDSHRDLLQLKVGALLAILDERLDVTRDDWQLAAVVVDTSSRVRDWVKERIDAQHSVDERKATARAKSGAAAAEEGRAEQATIERKALAIARWARTQPTVTNRDLSHRLKSTERHGLFDRVLGLLLAHEWLRPLPGDQPRYETTATADDSEEWPL